MWRKLSGGAVCPPRRYFASSSALFLGAVFVLGCAYLVYIPEQSDFWQIVLGYGGLFGLYAWVVSSDLRVEWWYWLVVALVARLILLPCLPQLSDDVYRFVWDGLLQLDGINPYIGTPTEVLDRSSYLTSTLYANLNSPDYYSIYPPVAQYVFVGATYFSPDSVQGAATGMRLFIIGCELGSAFYLVRLLRHYGLPEHRVLLYALNPLIIIELTGNLHFEAVMICFLLGAWYYLLRERWVWSVLFFGLAVSSKLLPLMFLPLWWRVLGFRRVALYGLGVTVTVGLLFLPYLDAQLVAHFGESLDLYFQRFEFNASVYYLARWVGFRVEGYNIIGQLGPILVGAALLGILTIAYWRRAPFYLPDRLLWTIVLYLALALTVHPWYVSLPVVFCVFTEYRFPLVWSYLITLTYVNYSYGVYYENLWVVGLEYVVVAGWAVWGIIFYSKNSATGSSIVRD